MFSPHYQYQPGGSLPEGAPTYVNRQADRDLYDALMAREYCYILNARQMGKSSLRIRTMERLNQQNITCTDIELSGIGSQQITADQWYGGMIQELVSGLELLFQRKTWMQTQADFSPVQRLSHFIETILLVQINTPVVIFIDEIDSVLGLGFAVDDFFALIRHCYEKRATNTAYRRLTFVLLGVATPSDLMRSNEYATPFNIGRAIPLQGFQVKDCAPLINGLSPKIGASYAALEEILRWSGGQPFLTQKLCWLVNKQVNDGNNDGENSCRNNNSAADSKALVNDVVTVQVLQHWEADDEPEHLRTIRDRLVRESQSNRRILTIYRKIVRAGNLPSQDLIEHLKLRLSGIVEVHRGQLRIKNPIYAAIFNLEWVDEQILALPVEAQRQASAPLVWPLLTANKRRWWQYIVAASAVGVGMTGVVFLASVLGVLEGTELRAFDFVMRLRPIEPPDNRMLLITVTEADVQAQPAEERGAASLSDKTLARLLARLEQGNPRVIGLDVYRQRRVDSRYPELAEALASNERLYGICHYGNAAGDPGVPPPPEIPPYQHGFNSVVQDADGVLRRQTLAVTSPSPCENGYALNWWLAARYLQGEGILQVPHDTHLQLGTRAFQQILSHTGGYRDIDQGGHQILINYRATEQIAQTVTLNEVLSDQFDLAQATDRVVLIGVVAPSFNDHNWFTPYSSGTQNIRRMSGVEIQAHMTSQIISAVLDDRPLLWSWAEPVEWVWTGSWSVLASVVAVVLRSRRQLSLVLSFLTVTLAGSCWIFICYGGWIPFVPAALGMVSSGMAVNGYRRAVARTIGTLKAR